jgi:hypothetical protein
MGFDNHIFIPRSTLKEKNCTRTGVYCFLLIKAVFRETNTAAAAANTDTTGTTPQYRCNVVVSRHATVLSEGTPQRAKIGADTFAYYVVRVPPSRVSAVKDTSRALISATVLNGGSVNVYVAKNYLPTMKEKAQFSILQPQVEVQLYESDNELKYGYDLYVGVRAVRLDAIVYVQCSFALSTASQKDSAVVMGRLEFGWAQHRVLNSGEVAYYTLDEPLTNSGFTVYFTREYGKYTVVAKAVDAHEATLEDYLMSNNKTRNETNEVRGSADGQALHVNAKRVL